MYTALHRRNPYYYYYYYALPQDREIPLNLATPDHKYDILAFFLSALPSYSWLRSFI